MNCYVCRDKGIWGYYSPIEINNSLHFTFIPQRCTCAAGQRLLMQELHKKDDPIPSIVKSDIHANEVTTDGEKMDPESNITSRPTP